MGEKLEREKIQASKHTRERELKEEGECRKEREGGRTAGPGVHPHPPPHRLAPSLLLGCQHVRPVQLLGADETETVLRAEKSVN